MLSINNALVVEDSGKIYTMDFQKKALLVGDNTNKGGK
jgi:hypothetical protein